jgi:hypothetical protein
MCHGGHRNQRKCDQNSDACDDVLERFHDFTALWGVEKLPAPPGDVKSRTPYIMVAALRHG